MKLRIAVIALLFLSMVTTASAHQDFWVMGQSGNIYVRVTTGYQYEMIKKAFIIGTLAEKLALSLNYTKPIFLDFNHYYVDDCEPDYFISFDKGEIGEPWEGGKKGDPYLPSKALVIRQVATIFNIEATLKLVEYAIANQTEITRKQKEIIYTKYYCRWGISSIDTSLIKAQLTKPNSKLVDSILLLRVDRPVEKFVRGVSYYWQNNQCHIFVRDQDKADSVLAVIDEVYYINPIGSSSALVFDTDSSFYYANQYRSTISKRQVIKDISGNFDPFDIQEIGGDKLAIYFSYYAKDAMYGMEERTLIYLMDQDVLIQDLDELIKKE